MEKVKKKKKHSVDLLYFIPFFESLLTLVRGFLKPWQCVKAEDTRLTNQWHNKFFKKH